MKCWINIREQVEASWDKTPKQQLCF